MSNILDLAKNILFPKSKVTQKNQQLTPEEYDRAIQVRNMIAKGQFKNDPRQQDVHSVYQGHGASPQPSQAPQMQVPQQQPSAMPTQMPSATPTPTVAPRGPTPTPVPGIGIQGMTDYSNDFIDKVVVPVSKRYGVDPAIPAAQFAIEGRLNGVGASNNNFYNMGVTDSLVKEAKRTGDWSKVPKYDSPEAGVERYMQFISGTGPDSLYANGADGSKTGKVGKKQFAEAWKKYKNSPTEFLKAIGPTYASTGDAYAENAMNTPEYKKYIVNKALKNSKMKK